MRNTEENLYEPVVMEDKVAEENINSAIEVAQEFGLAIDIIGNQVRFTDPDTEETTTAPYNPNDYKFLIWLEGFQAAGRLTGWPL